MQSDESKRNVDEVIIVQAYRIKSLSGEKIMSKEHKSIKAEKKKAALSPKEKKAAKKSKKDAKKVPKIF